MKLFDDYRFKQLEIKRLKDDKCIVTDSVQASDMDAPYTKRHVKITGIDSEKKRLNKARIERLEAECAYVEAAIAMAPNSCLRMILQLRYIDGLDWNDVHIQSGNTDKSVDTVKKKAYAYLALLAREQEKVSRK